jgi:hypothetical protein
MASTGEPTRRQNPEERHQHRCHENLKPHTFMQVIVKAEIEFPLNL